MATVSQIEKLAALTAERLLWHFHNPSLMAVSIEPPATEVLRTIFNVLFFASLKTEEGRPILARVYFIDPDDPDPKPPQKIRVGRWQTFALSKRITLNTVNLAKFAKSADPWSTGIAIYSKDGEIFIWGIVDQVLHLSTTIVRETAGTFPQAGAFHAVINGPADITVMGETTFIARLAQDVLIDHQNDCFSEGPINLMIEDWVRPIWREVFKEVGKEALSYTRDIWRNSAKEQWTRTVSRVLINIQRQRHGGALLISPYEDTDDLRIKHGLNYRRLVESSYRTLFYRILATKANSEHSWRELERKYAIPKRLYAQMVVYQGELEDAESMTTGAIRSVSSFAGVDGLILASPDLAIRGFGGIITNEVEVSSIRSSYSPDLRDSKILKAEHFGTRHNSMIRYCFTHPGALGLVVSQDGEIRAITRVKDECVVFENVKVHDMKSHTTYSPELLKRPNLKNKLKILES